MVVWISFEGAGMVVEGAGMMVEGAGMVVEAEAEAVFNKLMMLMRIFVIVTYTNYMN